MQIYLTLNTVGRLINLRQNIKSFILYVVDNVKHTSIAIIISLCTLIWGFISFNKQDDRTATQIELIKKQINLTVPPTIECFYEKEPEAISIRNTGIHDIKNVVISFTPFFIFENGKTLTIQGLHDFIRNNKPIQNRIRQKSSLNLEEDIYAVFPGKEYKTVNENRKETYSYIKNGGNIGKLTIESFHPSNFLLLSNVIGCKLIIYSDIRYKHSETNQAFNSIKYFLVEIDVREDLENIIGGKHIIAQIDNLINNTNGEIFYQ